MSLARMSLSGGIMIAAVIIVRALTLERVPKKTFLLMWYAALARLLVPWRLPCALSVYTLARRLCAPERAAAERAVTAAPSAVGGAAVFEASPAIDFNAAAPVPRISIDPWFAVWLLGALAVAVFFTSVYVRCRRQFSQSLPLDNDLTRRWLADHRLTRGVSLRQSDRISAPLTYGVLRPVILMPKNADWSDGAAVRCMLEHEYVHIRRFDAAGKLLLTAAVCAHWFNPLAWCMYVLANRDIELACDEAALRRLGPEARSAYAMALIRMAEAKQGAAPLCSGFGKNAVEERITAIMKMKKTSIAALLVAAGLVVGVTTVFATSAAPEDKAGPDIRAGAQTSVSTDTVLSYTDSEGKNWYSEDDGKTFISEEEYRDRHPETDVVWWTYDEYAKWLENEKVELQAMLGERGWTQSRGEFVWTQWEIDKQIAWYEAILEQIGQGMLVSKTVDGSEDTMLIQGLDDMMLGVGEAGVTAADFLEYAPYGLEWDEGEKALFFEGERVRYFLDGAEVDGFGGMAIRLEYADAELKGELDLHAVRGRVDNADGSYDPMGPLLRLEKCPEGMFDERASSSPALAQATADAYFRQVSAESNAETEKLLEKYAHLGLSWRVNPATGNIAMSYNGKAVHSLFDSVEQLWIANNLNGTDLPSGALELEAVYENGKLTGLRETEAAQTALGAVVEQGGPGAPVTAAQAVAEGTESAGSGTTFAEIFERYASLGITYVEAEGASGAGNVYYNGRLVSHFADVKRDGGVFSFTSADEGEIGLVQTVYDSEGNLVGLDVS